jgi:transcriptional regulator with XRE-family HTH domain
VAATPQARCHWWLLAAAVFFERSRRRLSVRAAACEIGVSTATLSRAENGNAIAIESALRLSGWLRLSPNVLFGFCPNNEAVTAPVTRETPPDDLVAPSRGFSRARQSQARKAASDAAAAERPAGQVTVIEGSRAYLAWCAHFRERRELTPFVQAIMVDGKWCRGFYATTRFPPRGENQNLDGAA